ncbi:MAG: 1-(5-phosphoribosyl)-5-amino-4-imidazole-carboxylate carboxylase [Marinilabiliales bacterium]|nr:MAG: 1-(5-phosphoribosyl)-5-amino-4-imidazole-carboxylate carboxylase [Marinilabiliales bacterium]
MRKMNIKDILQRLEAGKITRDQAEQEIKALSYQDLGYAKVDFHRRERTGFSEVIFCEGKSIDHITGIISAMLKKGENILGTRVKEDHWSVLQDQFPGLNINKQARVFWQHNNQPPITESAIAIVTAGTSDIPVAEEAAITAEFFGNRVERLYDVGVAGIHRLMDNMEVLRSAKVLIVVAGMEGALPSVVGGVVDAPVIAVPTSIGYGASFNGIAALLGMLNSCAIGVSVVNIDNGFGAACQASMINKI